MPYKDPEKAREWHRLRHHRKKAEGLCTRCFKPRGEDGTEALCRKCQKSHRKITKTERERRKREGLCIDCGGKIEPWLIEEGTTTCQMCYDKRQISNFIRGPR
jgi:hypothetical protein